VPIFCGSCVVLIQKKLLSWLFYYDESFAGVSPICLGEVGLSFYVASELFCYNFSPPSLIP